MKLQAIALGIILTGSANAETFYYNDNHSDGSSTTTRVNCNEYTNSCSASTYDNSAADNQQALGIGLAVGGLVLAGITAWMLVANHKDKKIAGNFAGIYEPRNIIAPMAEVDENGVKVIGFSLKRTF
jgi:hypothetical protein